MFNVQFATCVCFQITFFCFTYVFTLVCLITLINLRCCFITFLELLFTYFPNLRFFSLTLLDLQVVEFRVMLCLRCFNWRLLNYVFVNFKVRLFETCVSKITFCSNLGDLRLTCVLFFVTYVFVPLRF